MEGEGEDEERNGGEVNYKLLESPRASPSLHSRVWSQPREPRRRPRSCPPTTGTGRGVITPF